MSVPTGGVDWDHVVELVQAQTGESDERCKLAVKECNGDVVDSIIWLQNNAEEEQQQQQQQDNNATPPKATMIQQECNAFNTPVAMVTTPLVDVQGSNNNDTSTLFTPSQRSGHKIHHSRNKSSVGGWLKSRFGTPSQKVGRNFVVIVFFFVCLIL